MIERGIGIDIGGTHVKAVLVSAQGQVLWRTQADSVDQENAWQAAIVRIVAAIERDFGTISAVGVSAPGIARPDEGAISWMIGRMASVVDFNFAQHLRRPGRVPVLNDALAALMGEAWIGAARDIADAVLLTLGTGVGGAIMCGGRLLKGHTGRAGHLGHITVDAGGPLDICNTPGSVEYAIGNYSLSQRSNGRFDSTPALVQAHESGDPFASELWLGSVRKLAAAIVSIINVVDPKRIIIGGGMIHAGESLFTPLRAELARVEWRPMGSAVEIVPAMLGEWAGAIGAAANAMRAMDKSVPEANP